MAYQGGATRQFRTASRLSAVARARLGRSPAGAAPDHRYGVDGAEPRTLAVISSTGMHLDSPGYVLALVPPTACWFVRQPRRRRPRGAALLRVVGALRCYGSSRARPPRTLTGTPLSCTRDRHLLAARRRWRTFVLALWVRASLLASRACLPDPSRRSACRPLAESRPRPHSPRARTAALVDQLRHRICDRRELGGPRDGLIP